MAVFEEIGKRPKTLISRVHSIFVSKNSFLLTGIFISAFFLQIAVDQGANRFWRWYNKGVRKDDITHTSFFGMMLSTSMLNKLTAAKVSSSRQ
jgi:hypothetical protein